jgi:hypothetical protein
MMDEVRNFIHPYFGQCELFLGSALKESSLQKEFYMQYN